MPTLPRGCTMGITFCYELTWDSTAQGAAGSECSCLSGAPDWPPGAHNACTTRTRSTLAASPSADFVQDFNTYIYQGSMYSFQPRCMYKVPHDTAPHLADLALLVSETSRAPPQHAGATMQPSPCPQPAVLACRTSANISNTLLYHGQWRSLTD